MSYTSEQITLALTVLAEEGQAKKAAARLKAEGLNVTAPQLTQWRSEGYAAQYRQIASIVDEERDRELAAQVRKNIAEAAELAGTAIERTKNGLMTSSSRDASQAGLNMARLANIGIGDLGKITGKEPGVVSPNQDIVESVRTLVKTHPGALKLSPEVEQAILGSTEEDAPPAEKDPNAAP